MELLQMFVFGSIITFGVTCIVVSIAITFSRRLEDVVCSTFNKFLDKFRGGDV